MTRALLVLLFPLIVFSGCTSIQLEPLPEGMTDQPPADWDKRTQTLRQFNHWTLSGKLAVRQPSDSGTAVINRWTQQGPAYKLDLSSSFMGMGRTRLEGVPGMIELTTSGGDTYRSSDPGDLVEAATGWQLPIDSLAWWIRGLPAPDGQPRLLFNQQQKLAILEQDGWEIRYDRWHGFLDGMPELPSRITALKGDKRVRVVIANWRREE